jgi:KDO2-lipid IV(A) lauroyltransferase
MEPMFRLFSRLPLRVLHTLGFCLGWIVYLISPTYRRHFRENIRQAGVSQASARHAVAAAGRMVAELPWVWLRRPEERQASIRWDGLQLIEEALSIGKGLIYLTPHLGCFEVLPAAHAYSLASRYGPITVLYRPSRSADLDRLAKAARAIPGVQAAATTTAGVRALVKALRNGQAIGLLPDQVPEAGLGVWAPLFGRPAYTMTLALRLARRTGAPMLLVCGERLPRGQGYLVHVKPVVLDLRQADEIAAAQMNRQLEALIRSYPSLYLWGYARYKSPAARLSATS